ncbi:hypothetical protein DAC22_54 [Bacteroides phage DAC22]|nr:hypothetical protein DAC22_54 [Bacteroides phage DAC22]
MEQKEEKMYKKNENEEFVELSNEELSKIQEEGGECYKRVAIVVTSSNIREGVNLFNISEEQFADIYKRKFDKLFEKDIEEIIREVYHPTDEEIEKDRIYEEEQLKSNNLSKEEWKNRLNSMFTNLFKVGS